MEKSFASGLGGVYNPNTKNIEWKKSFKTGIVGISTYDNNYTTSSYSYPGKYE